MPKINRILIKVAYNTIKLEMLGKLNCHVTRVGVFLITIALIAGMAGCGPPFQNPQIRTWHDLDAIRDNLGGHYILMNDLDSTTLGYEELASPTANHGKGWQQIGAWEHPFSGRFDGQGYEIRDLFINRPDENLIGLFSIVGEGGVIENVGVVNADVTDEGGVSGLVIRNWDGTVSNSYSTASVIVSNSGVGALVGYNEGTVSNSYFSGSVYGDWSGSGLVGFNGGTVSNCYATGRVSGSNLVAGLVGYNLGTVSNSYSTGSVTGEDVVGGLVGQNFGPVSNCYATGNVSGDNRVGGLIGQNFGPMSDSYSSGNVTGYSRIGGLAGWNTDTVNNSYSTGSVTGNDLVGGLVGFHQYGTISNSYSTGSVTGNSSVGGLVGERERSTVSNSFWDTEASVQTTSDGGTSKTTAEMKTVATFSGAGWNVIAVAPGEPNDAFIWNIVDGDTYPFLSWQS
jgi:hypothetical protein